MYLHLLCKSKPIRSIWATCMGALLWHAYAANQPVTYSVPVEIYLYDAPETFTIETTVYATISSTRAQASHFAQTMLEAHISGKDLHSGTNTVALTRKNILVPNNINMLNLNPSIIHITL